MSQELKLMAAHGVCAPVGHDVSSNVSTVIVNDTIRNSHFI